MTDLSAILSINPADMPLGEEDRRTVRGALFNFLLTNPHDAFWRAVFDLQIRLCAHDGIDPPMVPMARDRSADSLGKVLLRLKDNRLAREASDNLRHAASPTPLQASARERPLPVQTGRGRTSNHERTAK